MSDILRVDWTNKEKRRWAYLLYRRLEIVYEEIELTQEILISMGAPPLQQLKTEFKWKKEYEDWSSDNKHLPNLIPADTIIERFKQRQNAAQQGPPSGVGAPGGVQVQAASLNPDQEARLSRLEQKLDKLIKHLGVK